MTASRRRNASLGACDALEPGRVPQDLAEASPLTAAERDAVRDHRGHPGRVLAGSLEEGGTAVRVVRRADPRGVPRRRRGCAAWCAASGAGASGEPFPPGPPGRVALAGGIPGMRPASRRHTGRGRWAYADPPYPGRAAIYVEREEVDHGELIARLEAGWPDGWALSTSAAALRDVLPLCPPGVRVCAWRRRTRPARSRRALSAWEALLVVGGRPHSLDSPQELLDVLDYRGRYDAFPGAMTGMKPPEFAVWMFRHLGARPGDELTDLFPGSGAIGEAWKLYTAHGSLAEHRAAQGG